ncbi:hypothetical protein AXX17_AT3G35210 [Arabidopsis thaliana]|uniref:Uncharacterized protein n=2 Tax=Arabidopsis TaxID=3701 RepID=A0A178V9Q3_ARATH|nr:hypothetical protein AXX17_AT3G35210 [Arabidopsis thaliana]
MVDEAEIRVLDVKCHISAAKDQKNFQIDEVRVSESVRAEILGSAKTPRFGSVKYIEKVQQTNGLRAEHQHKLKHSWLYRQNKPKKLVV